MKNKMYKALLAFVILAVPVQAWSQNYLGYSKDYIKNAIAANYKDYRAPVEVVNEKGNYIVYTKGNGERTVVYHFRRIPVIVDDGTQTQAEICVKYYAKNKCTNYNTCPQMDQVILSLDSHFEKGGTYLQWIDNSRRTPQEWVLVRDEDYFEVHVMEMGK